MKILILVVSVLLFNVTSYSQNEKLNPNNKFILKITTQSVGMTSGCYGFNYTLYADGRVERDNCSSKTVDSNKKNSDPVEKRLGAEFLAEFTQFVEDLGFLKAENEYKGKKTYTDFGYITTIIFQNKNVEKKVVIINYEPYDLTIPCFLHRLLAWLPSA